MFDAAAIRAQFPIFNQQVHGRNLCYLDSGASAQKPQLLLDIMQRIYGQHYANIHRGAYYFSEETTAQYEQARQHIAQFLHTDASNIVFTNSSTYGLNLVCHGFAKYYCKAGDKIVTTIMEHHANMVPWQMLRDEHGIILDYATITPEGTLDLEHLRGKLKGCKILALTHVSNVLGTINPLHDIIAMAHEEGAIVVVDGSQAVMHQYVDVTALDVDFYVFTGHKLYGPNGIGVLYGKADLLTQMRPIIGGGDMIKHVSLQTTTYADPPSRFEPGTPPIVEAIALGEIVAWFNAMNIQAINQHEDMLGATLQQFLQARDDITIIGNATHKIPTYSFYVDNCHVHDIATLLDQYGICVRAGLHCAEPLAQHYGVSGTIRASIAMYNNHDDIEHFCCALEKTLSLLQR